jgi:hypothetical protein
VDADAALDEHSDADGEGVWSWHPDAGAKLAILRATGAIKPGPRGERAISRKTTAQGMPDDSAEPVVPSPCFPIARGPWVAASTRHSLRPLQFEGPNDAKLGCFSAAGTRIHVAGNAAR